ncbi:MAG: hypothetical protein WEB30_11070, partial [Cyclobacteriaceae bacterium]
LAFACLLLGLWTGLNRIGWDIPLLPVAPHHGAIMVGGFLGSLISLEKIIPLRKKILYIFPVMSAASAVLFLLGHPLIGFAALVLASVGLTSVFVTYFLKERNLIYLLMVGGGICWLTGNVLLVSTKFYPMSFPWWLGFALCIITSERLELMKFLPVRDATKKLLVIFLGLYITGVLLPFHGIGQTIRGIALIAIALWLMRNDMIGISIRKTLLPRFTAVALLSGYVAMLLSGVFFLALKDQALAYDAIVHTFFLGFVFSMIFAHGPIILPGVLGISFKPYHKILYAWLLLLHLSWITRILADVILNMQLRKVSALASVLSILCYFATIATLTIISQRRHAKIL